MTRQNIFPCGITVFVPLLVSGILVNAQNQAYYLSSPYQGADLVLVNLDNNHYVVEKAYAFGDSVTQLNSNTDHYLPGSFGLHSFFPEDVSPLINTEPAQKFTPYGIPASSNTLDSISVLGKWHKIYTHEDDDRFVGGRPNQVNRYILVKDIGLVYSYSNFMDGHSLYMLCHQDSSKQRVLTAVYQHLSEKSQWFSEINIASLSTRYPFASCFAQLRKEWLEPRRHISLMSVSSHSVNREVSFSAVLKNTSSQAYYLPTYASFAPSKAIVHYPDSATWKTDLIDTHYGAFYKQLREDIYLLPGQEVHLTHRFPETLGCGDCPASIYKGFQFFSSVSLLHWLSSEIKSYDGNTYRLFPHREVHE